MDAGDFIQCASRWAVQPSSGAAEFRSAVSRAYYGAYHVARDLLNRKFHWHCNDANEHLWVQRHFQNCQLAEAREIGQLLANLHESRKNADYDLDKPAAETQANARACVERARLIEQQIAKCLADHLAAIQAQMTDYRNKANVR